MCTSPHFTFVIVPSCGVVFCGQRSNDAAFCIHGRNTGFGLPAPKLYINGSNVTGTTDCTAKFGAFVIQHTSLNISAWHPGSYQLKAEFKPTGLVKTCCDNFPRDVVMIERVDNRECLGSLPICIVHILPVHVVIIQWMAPWLHALQFFSASKLLWWLLYIVFHHDHCLIASNNCKLFAECFDTLHSIPSGCMYSKCPACSPLPTHCTSVPPQVLVAVVHPLVARLYSQDSCSPFLILPQASLHWLRLSLQHWPETDSVLMTGLDCMM